MATSMTFHDHIRELRSRVLWCVGVVAISATVGYLLHKPIIAILQKPINGPLYYFSPAGSFNFALKVSMFAGILIALPIFTYQAIRFTEPALPIKLKTRHTIILIFASLILALTGAAFAFYVIAPVSLKFFAGFSTSTVKPLISTDDYFSFIMTCLATFAVLFQIPLIVLFINRVKPMRPNRLMKYQRHIIVGAFVLAVVLPFTYDPVTQFIMAVPVVILFYASVILLWVTNRKRSFVQIRLPLMPVELIEGHDPDAVEGEIIRRPRPRTRPSSGGIDGLRGRAA